MSNSNALMIKLLSEPLAETAMKVLYMISDKISPSRVDTNILNPTGSPTDETVHENRIIMRVTINPDLLISWMKTSENTIYFGDRLSRYMIEKYCKDLTLEQLKKTRQVIEDVLTGVMKIYIDVLNHCNTELSKENQYIRVVTDLNRDITIIITDQVWDLFPKHVESYIENSESNFDSITTSLESLIPVNDNTINATSLILSTLLCLGIPLLSYSINIHLFPILLIMGIFSISWYYISSKVDVRYGKYMTMLSATPSCNTFKIDLAAENIDVATSMCIANEKCEAFDFTGNLISTIDNKYQVKYYTSISKNCKIRAPLNTTFLRKRKLLYNSGIPVVARTAAADVGDIYIDTRNSKIYELERDMWKFKQQLITTAITDLTVAVVAPIRTDVAATNPTTTYYVHVTDDMTEYKVFTIVDNRWVLDKTIVGPNAYKIVVPEIAPVIGVKRMKRNDWFVYIGVFALMIGVIGNVQIM